VKSLLSLPGRALGILLATGGMFAISTDSLITRAADVDGFTVSFWFGVFVVPAMLLVSAFRGKMPARLLREIDRPTVLAGSLQAASTAAFIFAIKNTSIANTVVIIAAAPVVAAFVSWIALRENTSRRLKFGITLSIVGILIVMSGSFGGGGLLGDLFAVGAITFWSLNLITVRSRPQMDRFLMVAIAGVILAVVSAIPAQIIGHDWQTYVLLMLMGFGGGAAGRVALSLATNYLPVAEVSLFAPIETLGGITWAWLFFDEVPGVSTFVGGFIVIVAFVIATVPVSTNGPVPGDA